MQTVATPRSVLVVDDEVLLRMVAVDLLQDGGFETLEAASGPEALVMLGLHPEIEAMVTDINMPGSPDGLGLANQARGQWPDLHILVTSGRISPRPEQMPVRSEFIGKPYTGDQLLAALRAAAQAI